MNASSKSNLKFLNSRGNAIVIVLVLVASALVSSLAVMQGSVNLAQIYGRKASSQVADNTAQLISSLMSEPNACLNGFDGAGGEDGLRFLDSGGAASTFNSSLAGSSGGQSVSLPSNFRDTAGARIRLKPGVLISSLNLDIEKLYAANAVLNSGSYDMDLFAQFKSSDRSLSPRLIMKLRAQIAGGLVTGCEAVPSTTSNRQLCEGMNCTYTVDSAGDGSCYCPLQPISCSGGNYVASIVNYIPQCSTTPIKKYCSASNGYMIGLDSQGEAICAQVLSCPTGTSATGLGGAATPAECKCANAAETWNGSACTAVSVSISGECCRAFCKFVGNSLSGFYQTSEPSCDITNVEYPYTNGSGECNQAMTSSSMNPAYCSATPPSFPSSCPVGTGVGYLGGAANPAGCFCNAGQNWDSGTSTCVAGSTPTMCPDGKTPKMKNWSSISVDYSGGSNPCTPYYNPSPPLGAPSSNCNHMPDSLTTCTYGGFVQACTSNCPAVTSCPTGSSPTGLGIAISASCRCDAASDVWDGTSCQTYAEDCGWAFDASSGSEVCIEGDPVSAFGGPCTAAMGRYTDSSFSSKVCNSKQVSSCFKCGPGSNIPAGICNVDTRCGGTTTPAVACYSGEAICSKAFGPYSSATKVTGCEAFPSQIYVGAKNCPAGSGQYDGMCQNCLGCPPGANLTGTGDATGYGSCKCDSATPTWDPVQTKCIATASCPSLSSTTGTGPATSVAGCKCNTTSLSWDGTKCVLATCSVCSGNDGVKPMPFIGTSCSSNTFQSPSLTCSGGGGYYGKCGVCP